MPKRKASNTCDSLTPNKTHKGEYTTAAGAVTKAQWDAINSYKVMKSLSVYSQRLEEQVDADWHDGYEEQSETISQWFIPVERTLQAVLDVGVEKKLAFEQCHQALMIVADSWRDMEANPARLSMGDMMGDNIDINLRIPGGAERSFSNMWERCPITYILGFVWRKLLRAAALSGTGTVAEDLLFSTIKDVADNGVNLCVDDSKENEEDWEDEMWCHIENQGIDTADGEGNNDTDVKEDEGARALRSLVRMRDRWTNLPKNIRTFRPRPGIDRRFDGTPERRTRDYHLDSEDDESW